MAFALRSRVLRMLSNFVKAPASTANDPSGVACTDTGAGDQTCLTGNVPQSDRGTLVSTIGQCDRRTSKRQSGPAPCAVAFASCLLGLAEQSTTRTNQSRRLRYRLAMRHQVPLPMSSWGQPGTCLRLKERSAGRSDLCAAKCLPDRSNTLCHQEVSSCKPHHTSTSKPVTVLLNACRSSHEFRVV